MKPPCQTLSRAEAAAYIGQSLHTFNAEVKAGTVPPPLPLKSHRKRWSRAVLDKWLAGPDAVPASTADAIDQAIANFAP